MVYQNAILVLLAGGQGTRLWPFSLEEKPKQFLDILDTGKSLLQQTCDRFNPIIPYSQHIIVSHQRYREILYHQFPHFDKKQFIFEPESKNTAPCLAYITYKLAQNFPDKVIIATPSDHMIFKEKEFLNTIKKGIEESQKEKLVTLGIRPTRPETGYGYIQYEDGENALKKVQKFKEKPNLDTAQQYLLAKNYLWNAGIVMGTVRTIQKTYEKYAPEMAKIFNDLASHYNENTEFESVKKAYAKCQNISIDYALLEKSDNVFTLIGDFDWTDLGNWDAVYEIRKKDENQNVLMGDISIKNSSKNHIQTSKKKKVIIEDLDDFLVLENDNFLVICKNKQASQLKNRYKNQ